MIIDQKSRIGAVLVSLLLAGSAAAQKHVSFPTQDGGLVYADVYGEGPRGVVLAHGGRFNKESWEKDGPRLPGFQKQYEKIPEPKHLLILDGSAHAQFLFQTDQGERVMREILQFLSAR